MFFVSDFHIFHVREQADGNYARDTPKLMGVGDFMVVSLSLVDGLNTRGVFLVLDGRADVYIPRCGGLLLPQTLA